jgi:hypothetical protein
MIELAKAVKDLVDGQAKFPDWNKRDDIKSALKVGLILLLDEFGYPPVERDEVYVEIFEQAENFKEECCFHPNLSRILGSISLKPRTKKTICKTKSRSVVF